MDDNTLQPGAAIPSGAQIGEAQPSPQLQPGAAIPEGAHLGMTDDQIRQAAADTHQPWYKTANNAVRATGDVLGDMVTGAGKGLGDTAIDLANLGRKGLNKLGANIPLNENKFEPNQNSAEAFGYGGESLLEFIMGDEAIKGLSMSMKLKYGSQIMTALEKSPKLMEALKAGASLTKVSAQLGPEERAILKSFPALARRVAVDSATAGGVQGAQTFVHTEGDLGATAKDAASMTGVSAVLGGATGTAGKFLNSFSDAAGKAENLADIAKKAADKESVASKLAKNIETAKNALHEKYDTGINDLKDRLNGEEIEHKGSPLHEAAQKLTDKGAAASDEFDEAFSQSRPGTPKTNKLVDSLSNADAKPTPEETEGADNEWVDANGVKHTEPAEVEDKTPAKWDIDKLIERRQLMSQRMRKLGYATSEDRADRDIYRKLIDGVDDTIGKLADQSGDDTAVSDYKALREHYRSKINLFDDPVIDKIRDGKMDDAAKAFVATNKVDSALPSAGKVRHNTDVLRQVLGDDGLKAFGKNVFGTMLKDSADESGHFNPAKFTRSWGRISDETKADLFDSKNVQSGLQQLAKDARSAAALQHLTRAGVLVPIGTAVGALGGAPGMGIGSALGLVVAETGGGIKAGREMLDYIATHPNTWKAYQKAGAAVNSTVARGISKGAQVTGGKALGVALGGANALNGPSETY